MRCLFLLVVLGISSLYLLLVPLRLKFVMFNND